MENNTLSFLVNLNIDALKAKADEGKRRFEELGKRAEQEGHKIDDIFKSLGAGTDFEDRLSALRNEMETCEDKIVISLKNIKKVTGSLLLNSCSLPKLYAILMKPAVRSTGYCRPSFEYGRKAESSIILQKPSS